MGDELLWIPWSVTRSSVVSSFLAGMSQLFLHLLRSFFPAAPEDGANLKTAGAMLNVNGQIVHLYAEARVLVAYESALHATFLNKASSGLIPW